MVSRCRLGWWVWSGVATGISTRDPSGGGSRGCQREHLLVDRRGQASAAKEAELYRSEGRTETGYIFNTLDQCEACSANIKTRVVQFIESFKLCEGTVDL